jgi:4-hydroxy-4-methyl-2-oxoglutarate aldolase
MTDAFARSEVDAARGLGSATLYEASGVDCSLDPGIRTVWVGAATAGPAYTVRCHPADNLPIHHAMERVSPGSVLVVDCAGVLAGYWGDVLTAAAQTRGVAGLVIDGGVRDVAQIREMGFPVFSRGVCVRRTVKHSQGLINVPIVIGGVRVSPGDLIVADEDGVIALPAASVAATIERGKDRARREESIVSELRSGRSTVEIYSLPARRAAS